MYLSDIFTVMVNLAGVPGLAVPIGFSEPSKSSGKALPIGMQILGPHFSEAMLYKIGHAYEQANPVWQIRPSL